MLKPAFFSCLTLVLASFLIPFRVSAADNWIEVRSSHLTVDTNAGEKDARRIADQFEARTEETKKGKALSLPLSVKRRVALAGRS